jgi:predicted NACHT family NTPase
MKKQRHIFISYQSGEADFSLRVAADLRNSGVKVWMDRLDMGILPSQDWRKSIEAALTTDKCSGLIAILSPAYITSRYCQIELARADRLGIPIYPIILSPFSDTQLPLEIERLHYIDFKEWRDNIIYQNKLNKLLDALKEKFPRQFDQLPDPETRYLTNLIAELEMRQGVANYVELEAETTKVVTRPSPLVDEETGYLVLISKEETKIKKRNKIHIKKISEVADAYPEFVLTGNPGAGKTTVIRNMALDLARRKLDHPRTLPIPMVIYLPQWQDNWSLEEFLKSKWFLDSNPLDLLIKGELCLYLDGLNEMGAEKLSKVVELRSWLSKSSGSAKLIVACRADDYNEDLRKYKTT